MPIYCEAANIAYIAIPKVACTSTKVLFYEINNHTKWPSHRIPFSQVHGYPGYATPDLTLTHFDDMAGFTKVAIVRDPVSRVISAYYDKARSVVLESKGLKPALTKAGLTTDPSPTLFAENIQLYSDICPVIESHIRPYEKFIGSDLGKFDQIFKLEEIVKFIGFISDRLGRKVEMPTANVIGSKKVEKRTIFSDYDKQLIASFCQRDYDLLSTQYPNKH